MSPAEPALSLCSIRMILGRFGYPRVALSAPVHPPLWDSFAIARALVLAGDRSQVVIIARTLRQRAGLACWLCLLSSVFTSCGSSFCLIEITASFRARSLA